MTALYILVKRRHVTIENYIVGGFIDTLQSSDDNTAGSVQSSLFQQQKSIKQTIPSLSNILADRILGLAD